MLSAVCPLCQSQKPRRSWKQQGCAWVCRMPASKGSAHSSGPSYALPLYEGWPCPACMPVLLPLQLGSYHPFLSICSSSAPSLPLIVPQSTDCSPCLHGHFSRPPPLQLCFSFSQCKNRSKGQTSLFYLFSTCFSHWVHSDPTWWRDSTLPVVTTSSIPERVVSSLLFHHLPRHLILYAPAS